MNPISLILADVAINTGGSSGGLVNALITIVVVGIILWLVWWLMDYLKLPEPINKVARALIALIAVIFLINFLLGLTGRGFIHF